MNATEPEATISLLRAQAHAAVGIVAAVGAAIKELGSVPSGHLYARLMGQMSLETYETIISNIVANGLIRRDSNHLLVWTGPSIPGQQQNQQQQQQNTNRVMKVRITLGASTQSIKAKHPVPRGATHFRFTEKGRKPVIDKVANLDTLAGCDGNLEYGSVTTIGGNDAGR